MEGPLQRVCKLHGIAECGSCFEDLHKTRVQASRRYVPPALRGRTESSEGSERRRLEDMERERERDKPTQERAAATTRKENNKNVELSSKDRAKVCARHFRVKPEELRAFSCTDPCNACRVEGFVVHNADSEHYGAFVVTAIDGVPTEEVVWALLPVVPAQLRRRDDEEREDRLASQIRALALRGATTCALTPYTDGLQFAVFAYGNGKISVRLRHVPFIDDEAMIETLRGCFLGGTFPKPAQQSTVYNAFGSRFSAGPVAYDFDVSVTALYALAAKDGSASMLVSPSRSIKLAADHASVNTICSTLRAIGNEVQQENEARLRADGSAFPLIRYSDTMCGRRNVYRVQNDGLVETDQPPVFVLDHYNANQVVAVHLGYLAFVVDAKNSLVETPARRSSVLAIQPPDLQRSLPDSWNPYIETAALIALREAEAFGLDGTQPAVLRQHMQLMNRPMLRPIWERNVETIMRFCGGRPSPQSMAAATSGPTVVLLCGVPGAGKSSFCKFVQRALPQWVRVSQDDAKSKKKCVGIAMQALQGGRSIVVDRCNMSYAQRFQWLKMAAQNGARRVDCVVFDVDPAVCIERVTQRADHPTIEGGDAKLASSIIYDQLSTSMTPKLAEGFSNIYYVSTFEQVEKLVSLAGWV